MQKQEASITPRVNRWVAAVIPRSAPWDVKHTRGKKTFPLREIKPHQRNYLMAATTKTGFTYKIPDIGLSHPPCDTVCYKNTDAYIVIVYPTMVYAIDIRILDTLTETTLTEERADALSWFRIERTRLPK